MLYACMYSLLWGLLPLMNITLLVLLSGFRGFRVISIRYTPNETKPSSPTETQKHKHRKPGKADFLHHIFLQIEQKKAKHSAIAMLNDFKVTIGVSIIVLEFVCGIP